MQYRFAMIDRLQLLIAPRGNIDHVTRLPSFQNRMRNHDRNARLGLSIINECTADCGENVGGSTAAPAAPEVASDGDGDGDPDPERQTKRPRTSRNSTPPAAILARPKDACTLLGIGRTKLHHLSERDPRFPRKIVLGARCVGWRVDALHDYLRTCEQEG